jgi:hypothetical protein
VNIPASVSVHGTVLDKYLTLADTNSSSLSDVVGTSTVNPTDVLASVPDATLEYESLTTPAEFGPISGLE